MTYSLRTLASPLSVFPTTNRRKRPSRFDWTKVELCRMRESCSRISVSGISSPLDRSSESNESHAVLIPAQLDPSAIFILVLDLDQSDSYLVCGFDERQQGIAWQYSTA